LFLALSSDTAIPAIPRSGAMQCNAMQCNAMQCNAMQAKGASCLSEMTSSACRPM